MNPIGINNKGFLYATNLKLKYCKVANSGTAHLSNIQVNSESSLEIANTGNMTVCNSEFGYRKSKIGNNSNTAILKIIASKLDTGGDGMATNGEVHLTDCYIRTGGGSGSSLYTCNTERLFISNCIIENNTRIICNKSDAIVKITNNIFKGSGSGSTTYCGLGLGTDNTNTPKFYIAGNTFGTTSIVISGNEATYATSANGQYMPEYANQFATITVTFNANDGTVSPATKGVVFGHAYGDLPTPTKADSTFVEWNTAADGTGSAVTSSTIVDSSTAHTLYAIWTEATT